MNNRDIFVPCPSNFPCKYVFRGDHKKQPHLDRSKIRK